MLCAVLTAAVASSALAAACVLSTRHPGRSEGKLGSNCGRRSERQRRGGSLQTDTVPYKVYASARKTGSLNFGSASSLSGASTSNPYPLIARIDPSRNMFVVWEDQGSVYGAISPGAAANTWGRAELIASGVSLAGFELDKAGNATVLVGTFAAVQVIDRPAGGSWGAPQTIASIPTARSHRSGDRQMTAVPLPFGKPTTRPPNTTQILSCTLRAVLPGVAPGDRRPTCRCR